MKTKLLVNLKKNSIIYIIVIPISLIFLFPYFFMITTSFKTVQQVFEIPPRLIPSPFVLDWYHKLFKSASHFPLNYFNSLYISIIVSIGVCFFGSIAGYSFAKINFKFKNVIFLILLSSIMISSEAVLVPSYMIMSKFGWINTHLPLLLPPIFGAGGIFCLFLFRKFYLTTPDDLIFAAKIDGCSQIGIYMRVMLPLSKSLLVTAFLLTFLARWDNLIDPLVYLNDIKLYTLPLAISMLNMLAENWTYQMAAASLATIPVLIVYLFSQEQLVKSIALSGIK